MKDRLTWALSLLFILAAFALALAALPAMPQQVATHWNARGQADGFSSPLVAVLLQPAIMAGLTLLMLAIPRIDPLKANIRLFQADYNLLIVLMNLFMFYLHVLIILWGLGTRFDMNRAILPAFGLLFYYIGVLLGKARRNYMIGIRTPWTLASETVWDKTHRLGGKLFKISGVLALVGVFFPTYAYLFLLLPVLAAAVSTIVYSYIAYRHEEKRS